MFREPEWSQSNCRAGAPPAKFGERSAVIDRRYSLFLDHFALGRVLLSVNHHALERVNRAEHLRVVALNKILVLIRLDRVAAAARREKQTLLLRTDRNANVRRHDVAVNRLFARCVIFRLGKTQR